MDLHAAEGCLLIRETKDEDVAAQLFKIGREKDRDYRARWKRSSLPFRAGGRAVATFYCLVYGAATYRITSIKHKDFLNRVLFSAPKCPTLKSFVS
jgi:hypothetical protein